MESFDFDAIVDLLAKSSYKTVAVQLSSPYLTLSVPISRRLTAQAPQLMTFYIIAHSSMDNAIDDVAAMHVNADAIVYFGQLMHISSQFPVIMATASQPLDIKDCLHQVESALEGFANRECTLLFAELEFHWAAVRLSSLLPGRVLVAVLPSEADLVHWKPFSSRGEGERVAGLLLSPSAREATEGNTVVVYVGQKGKALENLLFKYSSYSIIQYDPISKSAEKVKTGKEQQERYGGIAAVERAQRIGIIISTMGLDMDLLQRVLQRLQSVIKASGKEYYTFVMGRLSEGKLLNFPEISLFCLVGTEDVSVVKPKSFPVPVLSPLELEIGLGGRDWSPSLSYDLSSLLALDLPPVLQRVEQRRRETEGDREEAGEEGDEGSDGRNLSLSSLSPILTLSSLPALYSSALSSSAPTSEALSLFAPSALDFFRERGFQGLSYERERDEEGGEGDAEGAGGEGGIEWGQRGVAREYRPIDREREKGAVKDIEDI